MRHIGNMQYTQYILYLESMRPVALENKKKQCKMEQAVAAGSRKLNGFVIVAVLWLTIYIYE